ncbi:hypothetical protein HYN24_10950 [Dechloromonas sp. HYN0024]|nr:hypothetical protein HYN24_10950 [Dechloromonas sp. HYN0024]
MLKCGAVLARVNLPLFPSGLHLAQHLFGFGLALSKRPVKATGGDIGVDSKQGSGSAFWLTVRLSKAAR